MKFKRHLKDTKSFSGYEVFDGAKKIGDVYHVDKRVWHAYEPFAQLPLRNEYETRGEAAYHLKIRST